MEKIKLGILVLILIGVAALYSKQSVKQSALGSVESISGGYYATSTNNTTWCTSPGTMPDTRYKLLKNGSGLLGSVVITNSMVGAMDFYDATNTNTTGTAYSTSTLARIGASLVGNSYIFDVTFNRGLVVDIPASVQCTASSTITWK